MKTTIAFIFFLAAGSAWGQVANLSGAEVSGNESISDPARVAGELNDSWLAFTIPALDGTRSPCCWSGRSNQFSMTGCSLESRPVGFGSQSGTPVTENLVVFAKVDHGEVSSMRVVGEQCPVDGEGARVEWLGEVDNEAGLDWLEAAARSGDTESVRHSALYALAAHRDEVATQRLSAMARDSASDLQQQSIFWLGKARGEPGLAELKHLLAEEKDSDVLEQAVFAVSQLPDDMSGPMLLELARNQQAPREIRRQALFWMAQSDDEQTIAALTDLLTR